MNIYNDIDDYACEWLLNLIQAGELPSGSVVNQCIKDFMPPENASQIHLFAGIGGWPLALKMAGWPEHIRTLTGSCPCQPFSNAGKKKGVEDERHLWPEMLRITKEFRPAVIFGEQVASSDGIDWMRLVQTDLEKEGYEVGKLDLCAAGFGAPHIRQRIFWVAVSKRFRWGGRGKANGEVGRQSKVETEGSRSGIRVANGVSEGLEGHTGDEHKSDESGRINENTPGSACESGGDLWAGATQGFWSDPDWLFCRDGKCRPVEPGTFPLAHGLPRSLGDGSTREQRLGLLAAKRSRVGQLKGYGNAIVPQVAAAFITAFMEYLTCM